MTSGFVVGVGGDTGTGFRGLVLRPNPSLSLTRTLVGATPFPYGGDRPSSLSGDKTLIHLHRDVKRVDGLRSRTRSKPQRDF